MAAWPSVVAALVGTFPTFGELTSNSVYDGAPVSSGLDFYAIVGGTLPLDGIEDTTAGSYSHAQDPDGFQVQETGTVRCQVTSTSGSVDDTPAHRARVFVVADALEALIRADRTLGGVLSQNCTCDVGVDIASIGDGVMTDQTLVITVRYFTVY